MPATRTKRRRQLLGSRIEAADRGERAKKALARAKRVTGLSNGETPYGWRRVHCRRLGRDIASPDYAERVVMRYIRVLRNRGLSFKKIAERLEAVLARRENRPPATYPWQFRYTRQGVWKRYRRCVEVCGSGKRGDEVRCSGNRGWPL